MSNPNQESLFTPEETEKYFQPVEDLEQTLLSLPTEELVALKEDALEALNDSESVVLAVNRVLDRREDIHSVDSPEAAGGF